MKKVDLTLRNRIDIVGADPVDNFFSLIRHLLKDRPTSRSVAYQTGPRGGRYTVEDSHDGGTYRRYR